MTATRPDTPPADRSDRSDTLRRTLRRTLLPALLLAVSTGACDRALGNDQPADAPAVEVLSATATPGTLLQLRLTNASATSWSYNTCASPRLQRRVVDTWVDGPESFIICDASLTTLGAGMTLEVPYSVPAGLAPGRYRLRYDFGRGDGAVARPYTNSFVVP